MESRRIAGREIDGIDGIDDPLRTALKQQMRQQFEPSEAATLNALRFNPFLELSTSEIGDFEMRRRFVSAEQDLLLLRQLAAKIAGRRIALFAMPKSGSSFLRSAIGQAMQLPAATLTSVPADGGGAGAYWGINGREQEIDELALIAQTFRGAGHWVAQHHTRFTPYLGRQLHFYRITPIVLVRNVLDAIVSMDDMLMAGRRTGEWSNDPPYALPLDYPDLNGQARLMLLAGDFGIWLIKFLVSWKRAIAAHFAFPLILSYEEDILNPAAMAIRLADLLQLDAQERGALCTCLAAPPGREARFNRGVAGRGADVPVEARAMLTAYAQRFRADLGNDGLRYLFGDGIGERN